MTDEPEGLTPCPFCGDAMVYCAIVEGQGKYAIGCESCGATGPSDETAPASAWNRRADHSSDAGKMAAEPADDLIAMVHASPDPSQMPVLSDEDRATLAAEPASDLEKQIKEIIFWHVDFAQEDGGTTVTGIGSAARAILALFQPQMEAADEHQRTMEALKDPIAVLVNMQRGTIAVPSLRACLDLHGKLNAWDVASELLGAASSLQEVYADENACGLDKAQARRKLYDVISNARAACLGRESHD